MIRSKLLSERSGLMHAFTDRSGGVSAPPFDTLDLAFHVGDTAEAVLANHDRLADRLGYDRRKLVHMRQIHSDRIVVCTGDTDFDTRPECDALISNIPDQPLMVMTADCTPLLLFDPASGTIAAVHAGRAGALKNIVGKTLQAMRRYFESDPSDILAVLGPSIHGCCYEINDAIAAEVEAAGYAESLRRKEERPFLDVNTILQRQLENGGVGTEHIETVDVCTACASERFFSYRAHNARTGRQAGVIMLK